MAAIAYLLPPVSGLIAYLKGRTQRVRFHGLQSVAFGAVWPAVLYLSSLLTPGVTQAGFAVGAVVWIVLLVGAAIGRDVHLPGARHLARAAEAAPR